MEFLNCSVEHITFENPENGYHVIKVNAKGFNDLVTVIGNMVGINVGSVLNLRGEWIHDSRYGKQFKIISWKEVLPATIYGIEKYLGSGLVKGIGPAYAKRIVEHFGVKTLEIIDDSPDSLKDVRGIGKERVAKIKEAWVEQKGIKEVMVFLMHHGVSAVYAVKIYKEYGDESIKITEKNPYRLADDIWGIGFRTADKIAAKLGFDKESHERRKSGILYTLNQLSNDGHCFATPQQLLETAIELLEIDRFKILETISHMSDKDIGNIIKDSIDGQDAFYLPSLYYSEIGVANKMLKISSSRSNNDKAAEYAFDDAVNLLISSTVSEIGIEYSEIQREAIKRAILSKMLVITGGPGTGKTTTILGIISIFRKLDMDILLAAPTGRAAKRMEETCDMEAKTIHRLLGGKPPNTFTHDAENPLFGDVLIIDECSMIDIKLMHNLLRAVPDDMKVIFIGDVDQLPSVGAGNVLSDIISSGVIPVIRLDTVFRQAQNSDIIKNAHRINRGIFPGISNGRHSDFFFIEENDSDKIPQLIVDLCKERLPKHYGVDAVNDIQVLCPMKRSDNGTKSLNIALQEALNPTDLNIKKGGIEYRANDKVMQIRNNYSKLCFNGDIGIIKEIDVENREISVDFDDRIIQYGYAELDELTLAYATTIHKSQGSEYPIVVIPITTQFFVMLKKNLLYTGITRAKKVLVLIGSKRAISIAVRNSEQAKRNTGLEKRLSENKYKGGNFYDAYDDNLFTSSS